MIGLRFKSDVLVPDARFDTYKREFGEGSKPSSLRMKTQGRQSARRTRC